MKAIAFVAFSILAVGQMQEDASHYSALCDVTHAGSTYTSVPCHIDNGGTEVADDVYVYAPGVWGLWSITLDLSSGPWPWLKDSMKLGMPHIADYVRTERTTDGLERATTLLWGSILIHPLDPSFQRAFAAVFAGLVSTGGAPFEMRPQTFWVTVTDTRAIIWFEETVDDSDGYRTPTINWLQRHQQDSDTYGGAKNYALH
jgi:hypothetical protein